MSVQDRGHDVTPTTARGDNPKVNIYRYIAELRVIGWVLEQGRT